MQTRIPGRTGLPRRGAATTPVKGSAPSGSPWLGRLSVRAARPGGPHWPTEWRMPGLDGPVRPRRPLPGP
eukprot:10899266-Alexandrium_andersonii.AAC.1